MNGSSAARLRAVLRLLIDSGDITPQGVSMIEKVIQAEER